MSAIDNAKLLGENFAAWIKLKHPEFIEENRGVKSIWMAPKMIHLYNEFAKEMNEAKKHE
jgi:hypothetical protein